MTVAPLIPLQRYRHTSTGLPKLTPLIIGISHLEVGAIEFDLPSPRCSPNRTPLILEYLDIDSVVRSREAFSLKLIIHYPLRFTPLTSLWPVLAIGNIGPIEATPSDGIFARLSTLLLPDPITSTFLMVLRGSPIIPAETNLRELVKFLLSLLESLLEGLLEGFLEGVESLV